MKENIRKVVVATEGTYDGFGVYAIVEPVQNCIMFIPKVLDDFINNNDEMMSGVDCFLDSINHYKGKGYRVIFDKQTNHNFSNYNPLEWENK